MCEFDLTVYVVQFRHYFLVVKLSLAFWLILPISYAIANSFFSLRYPLWSTLWWLILRDFRLSSSLLVASAFGNLLACGRHRRIPPRARKKYHIEIPLTLSEQQHIQPNSIKQLLWLLLLLFLHFQCLFVFGQALVRTSRKGQTIRKLFFGGGGRAKYQKKIRAREN